MDVSKDKEGIPKTGNSNKENSRSMENTIVKRTQQIMTE